MADALYRTLEYLGTWEEIHNPDFKRVEFDPLLAQAGRNAFTMSPQKWISTVGAIGMRQKMGRNGGTFAHVDIAFEFASWVSPEFKLYIIKDYQRLKADENSRLSLDWNERRLFSKLNYRIHTDAIKGHLLPTLRGAAEKFAYANEADVLNVAVFGKTAKQWREDNPSADGNICTKKTGREPPQAVLKAHGAVSCRCEPRGHVREQSDTWFYGHSTEDDPVS